MKSKHDIPNKFDYMKAYSYNLVLTERTNCELEHEKNVGKVDSAFYRNFSWQIMGKKKERQLSHTEAIAKVIFGCKVQSQKYRVFNVNDLDDWMRQKKSDFEAMEIGKKDVVKIKKQEALSDAPSLINGRLQEISTSHKSVVDKVVQSSKTDFSGRNPKRYTTTCYFKATTVPAWFTESLLLHIGSTKRKYDQKVWFKTKMQPYYWSENMTTEVNVPNAQSYVSEVVIPTEKSSVHYISLEQQQLAASAS